MRKFIKRYIAVFMAACVILGGWNVQEGTAQAATFSDINQDSVFLKQPGGSNLCTLVAATMMVRRGAMMNGNDNWASISTDMMRSAAWVEGIGLKWNFTCGSVTVAHDSFPVRRQICRQSFPNIRRALCCISKSLISSMQSL